MDDQIFRGEDGNALRFLYRPVKNNFQSEKNGRIIYDTVLTVEVMTPGSNESAPTFDVERVYCDEAKIPQPERTEKYAQYLRQIEAFKAGSEEHADKGTPITRWVQIDVGMAATLKAQGVHTVEMLAGIDDVSIIKIGLGGRVLRDQAIAFLNTQQFGVPSATMAAELSHLREANERLSAQLESAIQRLNQLEPNIKPQLIGETLLATLQVAEFTSVHPADSFAPVQTLQPLI